MMNRPLPPSNHDELDEVLHARLMTVIEDLAKNHGVMIVAVAVAESDVSSVVSNMSARDASVALSAALCSYEQSIPHGLVQ